MSNFTYLKDWIAIIVKMVFVPDLRNLRKIVREEGSTRDQIYESIMYLNTLEDDFSCLMVDKLLKIYNDLAWWGLHVRPSDEMVVEGTE